MPVNTHAQRAVYLDWWVGKYCRLNNQIDHEYKKVVDVITYGPPSYVYGTAVLVMEDGEEVNISHRGKRPTKGDVEIKLD